MLYSVYVNLARADVPPGILQLLDLDPNTSQPHGVIDPPGQTRYVSFPMENDVIHVVSSGGGGATKTTYQTTWGLATYLMDKVNGGGLGAGPNFPALTPTQARTAALALQTRAASGLALTLTDINAVLAAVLAATALTTGGSVGTVEEVLRILAGERFYLPAGTVVQLVGPPIAWQGSHGAFVGIDGTSAITLHNPPRIRNLVISGALYASIANGHIYELTQATYTYLGVTGRAITVYDVSGNVLA